MRTFHQTPYEPPRVKGSNIVGGPAADLMGYLRAPGGVERRGIGCEILRHILAWRPWVETQRAVSARESVRPSAGTIARRRANRQGGAGAKLRPAGPAEVGLAGGLGLVESAHGRRHGGV